MLFKKLIQYIGIDIAKFPLYLWIRNWLKFECPYITDILWTYTGITSNETQICLLNKHQWFFTNGLSTGHSLLFNLCFVPIELASLASGIQYLYYVPSFNWNKHNTFVFVTWLLSVSRIPTRFSECQTFAIKTCLKVIMCIFYINKWVMQVPMHPLIKTAP